MRQALDWLRAHNANAPVTERLLSAVLLIKAVAGGGGKGMRVVRAEGEFMDALKGFSIFKTKQKMI